MSSTLKPNSRSHNIASFNIGVSTQAILLKRAQIIDRHNIIISDANKAMNEANNQSGSIDAETIGVLTSTAQPVEELHTAQRQIYAATQDIRNLKSSIENAQTEINSIDTINKYVMIAIAVLVLILFILIM